MKKSWLGGGLAVLLLAGPALAQDYAASCEKFKGDLAKQKANCAEENAEAAKLACKTKDDMNAALKLFQKCGSKAVAAATAGAKAGSAGAGSTATKEWKCKAVDPKDSKDIAEAVAPKMTECTTALKEKVKAARCSATTDKVEFLNQSWVVSKWSPGTKSTVACK
jgi:hypothetical protein